MKLDIRVNVSFLAHRKRKKLQALLGAGGPLSLVDLWLNTAQNRPKGVLTGMSEQDIAIDAAWPGNPGEFCKALCDVGFMDRGEDGTYSIHDWKEHQRYVYFSEERSNVARNAAEKRWKRERGIEQKAKEKQASDADIMLPAYGEHTKGNAPSPFPFPSPSPKKHIAVYNGDFLTLWKEYPPRNGRKDGKREAWEEWKRISPDAALQNLMLERLKAQKFHREQTAKKGKTYEFPDLCRWLKHRRWEDEMEVQEVESKWKT